MDGNGADRVMIGVPEEGDALIALGDGQGQPRIVLSEVTEGVGLQLRDGQGHIRANLVVQEQITALSFQNDQGQPRVTLASNPDTAFLALYDPAGNLVMGIRVDPNGKPQIVTERLGDILSAFGNGQSDEPSVKP
jgi:hypothetical protein